MSGVGTDVTTLVIGVDGKVKSQQLDKVLVLGETKLVGKVEGVILILLDLGDLAALEDVLVDAGCDGWKLCDQIHGILEGVLPVLGLLQSALSICLCEGGLVLESSDCKGELCHWVEIAWTSVDEFLNELWNGSTSCPLGGQVADLLLAWNLTSEEKPEKTYKVLALYHRADLSAFSYLLEVAPFRLELLGEALDILE